MVCGNDVYCWVVCCVCDWVLDCVCDVFDFVDCVVV